jgi:hypothetical protein
MNPGDDRVFVQRVAATGLSIHWTDWQCSGLRIEPCLSSTSQDLGPVAACNAGSQAWSALPSFCHSGLLLILGLSAHSEGSS